jgi:N-acetyl-gamma-glutamyl-phosphate reductase
MLMPSFGALALQGASGQALQNMNLIMGMPEETGLLQQAMFP